MAKDGWFPKTDSSEIEALIKLLKHAVAPARFWGWELVDDTTQLQVGNVGAMVIALHNHQSLSYLP